MVASLFFFFGALLSQCAGQAELVIDVVPVIRSSPLEFQGQALSTKVCRLTI